MGTDAVLCLSTVAVGDPPVGLDWADLGSGCPEGLSAPQQVQQEGSDPAHPFLWSQIQTPGQFIDYSQLGFED